MVPPLSLPPLRLRASNFQTPPKWEVSRREDLRGRRVWGTSFSNVPGWKLSKIQKVKKKKKTSSSFRAQRKPWRRGLKKSPLLKDARGKLEGFLERKSERDPLGVLIVFLFFFFFFLLSRSHFFFLKKKNLFSSFSSSSLFSKWKSFWIGWNWESKIKRIKGEEKLKSWVFLFLAVSKLFFYFWVEFLKKREFFLFFFFFFFSFLWKKNVQERVHFLESIQLIMNLFFLSSFFFLFFLSFLIFFLLPFLLFSYHPDGWQG